jgi:hypothetical protein
MKMNFFFKKVLCRFASMFSMLILLPSPVLDPATHNIFFPTPYRFLRFPTDFYRFLPNGGLLIALIVAKEL